MNERLKIIQDRYNEINEELLLPEVLSDFSKQKTLSKEKGALEPIVLEYEKYLTINKNIEELSKLINDQEMHEMVKEELDELTVSLDEIKSKLEVMLLPKGINDGKDIIMEIHGAAGGDEGNIFAGDLFRMYFKYAEKNNWKIEIDEEIIGTSGGYTRIGFTIRGNNVYSKLKFESGVHRVQRVPQTETQGRIHTSTATVIVMPEVEDV